MKICILTTSYPLNDGDYSGHFIRSPARLLASSGHLVEVIAPDDPSASTSNDANLTIKRFKYFPIRSMQKVAYGSGIMPNLKSSLLAKLQLPFFMLSFLITAIRAARHADIIHAHWSISGLIGLLCKKIYQKPVVLHIRGSDFQKDGNIVLEKLTKFVALRADATVTVSDEIKKRLECDLPPECNIRTIRNGIDLDKFYPNKTRDALKNTLAHEAEYIILFAGRLTKVKGPDIALEAFREFLKTHQNAFLVFAGNGDMAPELQQKVMMHHIGDKVLFLGFIPADKMSSIYNAADCLVITSRSEGIPNCLYEAFACGLPVVSTPTGGTPEIINDNITGFLTEDNTSTAISRKLCKVAAEHETTRNTAQNAYRWTQEHISWHKHVLALNDLYNELI